MVLNPVLSKLSGKLVVLASASPRRLDILTNAGVRFEVVPSWFKETLDKTLFKRPYEYAVETAKNKALEVAKRMPCKHLKTPDIVIGADTIVTVDGLILEKPVDKQDAYSMLSRLNGKEHSVFTGVAVVLCHEKESHEIEYKVIDFYEETKVKFAELSEEMLWEYIHSGEPMDKAGGYGIQALGGMLVERVHGDFLNVVGFPLNHFCKELDKVFNSCPRTRVPGPKQDSPVVQGPLVSKFPECVEKMTAGDMQQAHTGVAHKQAEVEDEYEAGNAGGFPHRIAELLDGFKASKTLFTACKLKVFDLLASEESLTATQVAQKIQASVQGTERLLDAAVSLGLLEKLLLGGTAVYRNTEQVSRWLVSTADLSLSAHVLHCSDTLWPLFAHLESGVREGTRQHERAFGKRSKDSPQEVCYNSEEMKLQFMNAMHSITKVTGRDVATAFDLTGFRTVCDLGGCSGAMAYEFIKAHSEMSVTVFDLPDVIAMSSHFRPHDQNSDRVTYAAGDFFKDDLPKADLYILARILHDFSDEKIHILLSKLSETCSPGSGVLVAEIFLDEDRRGPSRGLLQALSMTEGIQRTATEYCHLLEKYGFVQALVKRTGNFLDAMLAIKK